MSINQYVSLKKSCFSLQHAVGLNHLYRRFVKSRAGNCLYAADLNIKIGVAVANSMTGYQISPPACAK